MNYDTSIHTFAFVHGFNSLQRFHQTHHGRMMLQQHVRCSSVQCRMIMKCYVIKNANFCGKKWCLAFNALFDFSNVVWPCCAVYTCETCCFHRYDPCASKISVNLIRETSLVSRDIFSWNHDPWTFDILNEHDGMHQFSC